jgi:regulator of RNase E activity RraA
VSWVVGWELLGALNRRARGRTGHIVCPSRGWSTANRSIERARFSHAAAHKSRTPVRHRGRRPDEWPTPDADCRNIGSTQLHAVSTATITTALFKRGLRRQMIQDVQPLDPAKPTMVGEAFTLRYMPAREDLNPITVFQDRGHPQRKAVEECPPGAVFVIDSRKDARAASAGAILVTRLQVRGVAGIVTDGGLRDSGEIARLDMPAFHLRPSAPTNLTLHQAIDINVPIGCGDAPVFPGDVIVGDADGVVVIPAHLADEIAEEAVEMTVFEDFVAEKVSDGRSILGLYPATEEATRTEFAAWRKDKGR